MRILFATTLIASRPESGGDVVSLATVETLRQLGCEVTVLGYLRPGDRKEAGRSVIVADRRPIETSSSPLRAALWMARSFIARRPYTSQKFVSRRYVARLLEFIDAHRPDAICIDHTQMAWLLDFIPETIPVWVMMHNAESELYARGAAFQKWAAGRLLYRREARTLRVLERRVAARAARIFVLCEADRIALRSFVGEVRIDVLPVTPEPLPLPLRQGKQPRAFACDIALLATWSWQPNQDALRWFIDEVRPRLPAGVTIHVAGRDAGPIVEGVPGVTYRGFVESADAFLASARVVAVPTRYGGGVETKVLMAIQSGAPTVATPASVRGLGSLPTFVAIADDAETFAGRLIETIAAAGAKDTILESTTWLRARRAAFVGALRDAVGLAPAQPIQDQRTLALSVVMPTRNRAGLLPQILASLSAQTCEPGVWELIVVDDGSTDETAGVLKRFAATAPFRVTIRQQKNAGPGAARNAGAAIATGKRLLFLDDDMVASERLILEHARHADDPLACVIGRIVPPETRRSPWMAWEDAQLLRHADELTTGRPAGARDVYSGNVSVPAALAQSLGGYRVNLKRGEDFELGYRLAAAGANFVYAAKAKSTHLGTHEYAAWIRNAAAFGRAEVALRPGLARDVVTREAVGWYEQRHLLNRIAVRLCSASPIGGTLLTVSLQAVGQAMHLAGARRLANGAYSALYNIAYWQGLIESIGPDRFWSAVKLVDAAVLEPGRSAS